MGAKTLCGLLRDGLPENHMVDEQPLRHDRPFFRLYFYQVPLLRKFRGPSGRLGRLARARVLFSRLRPIVNTRRFSANVYPPSR